MDCAIVERQMLPWQTNSIFIILSKFQQIQYFQGFALFFQSPSGL